MEDFFTKNGKLAQALLGFEARRGQQEMAKAVAELLSSSAEKKEKRASVLLVEAETGIGKTLAYLVPALFSGQRVVISTATITLQDQILKKEIPLLARVLDTEIPVLCMKGRQNYLCYYRWYQYRLGSSEKITSHEEEERIDKWLGKTESGDRAELHWLPDKSPLWPRISAQSNQCLGGDCPEFASCFVNKMRKKAGSARLLIVNHHLFFSDLALKQSGYGEILPRYQTVIFDEAHHMENVATTFFGQHFSHYQLLDLLADIQRQGEEDLTKNSFAKITAFCLGLKSRLEHFATIFPKSTGRYPLLPLVQKTDNWNEQVDIVARGLEQLAEKCVAFEGFGEIWNMFAERSTILQQTLLHIAGARSEEEESTSFIRWYERRKRTVSLSATPIQIAGELEKNLYGSVESIIMASATLTTGGDFTYIRERLGVDETAKTLCFHSPFDYKRRTLLYVPESTFPETTAPHYTTMLCERMHQILCISKGRALLLFTSFKVMELVAEYLYDKVSYPVLVQGTASRQALLETFREKTDSVLLAVASFWEGVDIAGDSLSCVLIDKLPFEVPSDPVIQARMQGIENAGGKPFFSFQVPRAILSLRQGVGRLMRSSKDQGVIGILDIRLFSKGYGRIFRASLPPSPVVRTLEEVEDFFADEHRRERDEC